MDCPVVGACVRYLHDGFDLIYHLSYLHSILTSTSTSTLRQTYYRYRSIDAGNLIPCE